MGMAEGIIGEFSAIQSVSEEYGVGEPCVLFLTNSRVIVAEFEGLSSLTFLIPVVLFVVAFAGLFAREFLILLIGLAAAIVSGLLLIAVNYALRNRRLRQARRLSPDRILTLSKSNFEIPYIKIAKVELRRHEEFRGGGRGILLPSLPEYKWTVDFSMQSVEDRGRTFILKGSVASPFKECIKQYVPEIIEHEPLEKSIFERRG
jgi:hypothetical protein